MRKLVEIVKLNYEFSHDEIEQETLVTGLVNGFVKILNKEQYDKFVKFLIERDNLENIKIANHIITTHKICKDVFKLR